MCEVGIVSNCGLVCCGEYVFGFCIYCLLYYGYFNGIVGDKLEEGGDDVRLLWFLWVGLYMLYNGWYRG